MSGHTRNTDVNQARIPRALKLTATARAIRSALTVSAAMFALTGSGVAIAGVCGVSGPNVVSCDGAFDTPSPDSPLAFAIDDLTVILGGNSPSSVNSTGVDGIQLTGAGGSETLLNYGGISAYGGGDANAVDIAAYGGIVIANGGSLLAGVYSYGGSVADVTSVAMYSAVGDIVLDNQAGASIVAIADHGDAIAVAAVTGLGSIDVTNAGDIQASSHGHNATGVSAYAHSDGNIYPAYSNVAVANSGTIGADLHSSYGRISAWGVYGHGHDVSVVNDGSVSAVADVVLGNTTAIGVFLAADSFSTLVNGADGDISAVAANAQGVYLGPDATAIGALVSGSLAGVSNYGSISAESVSASLEGIIAATGVQMYSPSGIATIVNSGDISASAVSILTDPVGYAHFAYVFAYGTSSAPLFSYYPVAATTINSGHISASAAAYVGGAYSYGAITKGSNAAMYNDQGGVISATSTVTSRGRADATAVSTAGFDYAHDVNAGSIVAYASSHAIINDGRFTYGAANATGVKEVSGLYGVSMLVNYGDIDATAITRDSTNRFLGGVSATAVYQYGWLYAEIDNQGEINARADVNIGTAMATGIKQQARYYGSYVGNQEGASIRAAAYSGSAIGDDGSGLAAAYGVQLSDAGDAIVYNSGLIETIAVVDPGERNYFSNPGSALAVGDYQFGTYGAALHNSGDIDVKADGDFAYATAYGAKLVGWYIAVNHNSGAITVVADADGGNALASASNILSLGQRYANGCSYQGQYGCYAYTYGYTGGIARLDNQGSLRAQAGADAGVAYAYGATVVGRLTAETSNAGAIVATANAGQGMAVAFGSISDAESGFALLGNTGGIRAQASGDNAAATGALVIGSYGDVGSGYNAASVTNAGSITALADGDQASTAIGLRVAGRYVDGVSVLNAADGEIVAAAYGLDATATAVSLYSAGVNALTNNGLIAALGDGLRIAVASSANAQTGITNNGTMIGSIQTGNGDDIVDNAGVWNAVQHTDLGAGDDSIQNASGGTIGLHDASISLGAYSGNGNTFDNFGTITVSGSDNAIDMGTNASLAPAYASHNPNAFDNAGVIDFRDGAADDVLTIAGDFAGDGVLNLDVSGLNGASDMLHIYGDVIAGTHDTINMNFIGLPTTASSEIAIVTVSGNSAPGDFTLGAVNYSQAGFFDLGFRLISHQDASNASDDVYSLGVDVTGLNAPGVLAASVVPGVQSLMNAQVGTWRQRMSAIDGFDRHGISLWARLFQDKGTIDPDHEAADFGQGGDFGFDQKNSGAEAGADVAINDEVSIGVLAAKTEASQRLNSGPGSSTIKADTYGVYGTWVAPGGFYLDGSYRWMSFTAKMNSAAGGRQVAGDATAFNLEAGHAWTLESGLQIEPQFQYTRTHVGNVDAVTVGSSAFQAHDGNSERSRLGVMFRQSHRDAGKGTLWTPYASINAVRESGGNNAYTIGSDFSGRTRMKGTSGLIELGMTAQTGNLSVYGGLNWQDGGAMHGFLGGQLGLRYTFGAASRQ